MKKDETLCSIYKSYRGNIDVNKKGIGESYGRCVYSKTKIFR